MPSLDQIAANPQVHRLIIYGPTGSGKTWSIGKGIETHVRKEVTVGKEKARLKKKFTMDDIDL